MLRIARDARYFILLIFLLRASLCAGAIGVGTPNSTTIPTTTGATFSHAVAGLNPLSILCIQFQDGAAIMSTPTLGGVSMTLVASIADGPGLRGLYMYRLVNPPLGSQIVAINWDSFIGSGVAGIITFNGVDQSSPLGTPVVGNIDNAGPASINVTSATGELVIDCVAGNDVMNIAANASQSVLWEIDPGSIIPSGSSTKPGAASVNMSWTLSQATDWKLIGVSVKPLSIITPTRRMGPMVMP
jgi:hypothetical protein